MVLTAGCGWHVAGPWGVHHLQRVAGEPGKQEGELLGVKPPLYAQSKVVLGSSLQFPVSFCMPGSS